MKILPKNIILGTLLLAVLIITAIVIRNSGTPQILTKNNATENYGYELTNTGSHLNIHEYYGVIFYQKGQSTIFKIIPDDCVAILNVNKINLDIGSIGKEKLCDHENGFMVNLQAYLKEGRNEIVADVLDYNGNYSLQLIPENANYSLIIILYLLPLTAIGLYYLTKPNKPSYPEILLVGVAYSLYLAHLLTQYYDMYSYDLWGHLEYVRYLLNNYSVPPIKEGWQFYQPPLYYIFSALITRFNYFLNAAEPYKILQITSIYWYTAYLFFMVRIAKLLITKKGPYLLTLAIILFWPIGQIIAIRINNDVPTYAVMAACLYFMISWIYTKQIKYVYWALIITSICLLVKNTALIIYPVIILPVLYSLAKGEIKKADIVNPHVYRVIIFCALCLILSFARPIHHRYVLQDNQPILVGNVNNLDAGMRVKNSFINYIILSPSDFINTPFFYTREDNTGRHHFWTVFIKSSLFGEFGWKYPAIANGLNLLLLCMIIYLISTSMWSAYKQKTAPTLNSKPLYFIQFTILIMIIGLIINRTAHPFTCSADFRYIFPASGLFAILYGNRISSYLQNNKLALARTGIVLGLMFAGLSLCFVLLQEIKL